MKACLLIDIPHGCCVGGAGVVGRCQVPHRQGDVGGEVLSESVSAGGSVGPYLEAGGPVHLD